MHIVQILPELNQGGVETIVLTLNRELVKRGHTSTVISNGGTLAPQIEADGGRHITLDVCSKNPLTFFSRVCKLQKVLASEFKVQSSSGEPLILHAHSRVPAWLARFANKKLNVPFVTTVHGFNSVSRYSEIMTKGDRVICVSNPVRDYILENYSVDRDRIRVIHSGIDLAKFDPARINRQRIDALRSELGLQGKQLVTSVGRITELKDYETFIKAISLAIESNPDIRALIVGNVRADKQTYHQELQQLVQHLNLEKHVHFLPHCPDLPELYTLSSVVVSCSKKPESFGLTLIEALAMNTPVIATRHGGPLDIITEGQNGCFFEKGNAAQLAQLLTQPPSLPHELRPDIVERFSLNKMIDSTLAVYIASARHD